MRTLLLIGLAVIGLNVTAAAAGINLGTALVSGDVASYVNRQESGRMDLSAKQLQGMTNWLNHHRSDWRANGTEASSEPVQLGIDLKHSDGAVTSISVIARANGGHYLRLIGPGKWAYEGFLGLWKSWAATRVLSEQELTALENLVGVTASPPH